MDTRLLVLLIIAMQGISGASLSEIVTLSSVKLTLDARRDRGKQNAKNKVLAARSMPGKYDTLTGL